MSALEIRDGIRSRSFSSAEAVRAHLDRIEAVNPSLNAVVRTLEDSAISEANTVDKLLSKKSAEDLPELLGVPFTVKENINLIGSPTTAGLPALADAYPEFDSPVVALMKKAGAIPFARTNMPDGGLRWDTDSSLHGRTLNPWNSEVTAGGSSGGEAAAIASGMSPLGLGGDFAGSLRIPAWACGVCALKPGRGRIPGGWASGPMSLTATSWSVQGPLARTVDDLVAALTVLSHPDSRDPNSQPPPIVETLDISDTVVAVVENPSTSPSDPAVVRSIQKAATALEQAGFKLESITPPRIHEILDSRLKMHGYDIWELSRNDLSSGFSDDALKYLDDSVIDHHLGAVGYFEGLIDIVSAQKEWSEFMERYPLILGPVYSQQQFAIGDDLKGPKSVAEIAAGLALTTAVNAMELPSVALCTGVDVGLPQGIQIIGRRMREEECLAAARVVEAALGIITPIDPVSNRY